MTTFATGKKSYAISDRSGQRFPYDEMVTEWNGLFVHISEYEPKQPQLEPKVPGNDPQGLLNARPDRVEPLSVVLLSFNPFLSTASSSTILINEPGHEKTTGDKIIFINANAFNGFTNAMLNTTLGFSLTVVNTNQYTINAQTTASAGGNFGGKPSVGPSAVALPNDAFKVTAGSSTIQVNQPDHGKSTGDTVKFQNLTVVNAFLTASGFSQSVLTTSSGYSITIVNKDNYSFNASSGTGTISTTIGGGSATAETI
jgi:hypothetical protein